MELQLHSTFALAMAIALALPASGQTGESSHQGIVQTHFSAEDNGVKSPVTIPQDVMGILAEDHFVKDQMENEELKPAELPRSWFSASRIQLGPTKADGLIVQATGPLVGANVVVFWVFVQFENEWKLALMHDPSSRLDRDSNAFQRLPEHRSRCDDVLQDHDSAVSIRWPQVHAFTSQERKTLSSDS